MRKQERLNIIRERLGQQIVGFGAMTAMVSPVTGVVMFKRGPAYSDTITQLAAEDPRVLTYLEKFLATTLWMDVANIGVTLVVAQLVDRRVVKPDSFLAGMVAEEIEIVQEKFAEQQAAAQREAAARAAQNGAQPEAQAA